MAVFTTLALATTLSTAGVIAAGTAIYGATAGVVSTVKSVKKAEAAAVSARQATEVQIVQQQQQATRQRRSAVRSSVIARAQAQQAAQTRGVGTSSGALGGLASLSSQLGSNLGYGSMMSGLGQQFTALSGLSAQQSADSAKFGAIANIGFGLAKGAVSYGPGAAEARDFF
jgi:hypothetical protein